MPSPAHAPEIPEDRLDADALHTVARLRHAGHQAFFVGGCVRDLLLGRLPKDFDLATSAHPGEVRATFRNCRLIGRRFRLAHVFFRGGKVVEVATFRKSPVDVVEDGAEESDLLITRANVFGTAVEDARRRDFTVNGLFYDPFAGEVIDFVGGRADLEAHRMSTIGEPEIRMREDPVRALRAVRFAARLGFTIEPETFAAMRRHAAEIGRCAPPRLLEETFKILRCGASARGFELLRTCGALPLLLPPLAAFLDRSGDPARRRFAAHLAALDEHVGSGNVPDEAVLLGVLLTHLPQGETGAGPGERDALLSELVATARLPKRIAEGARLALAAQRTLRGTTRRRRRGPAGQASLSDALLLMELSVKATGEGVEALARSRAESAAQGEAGSPVDPDDAVEAEEPDREAAPPRKASSPRIHEVAAFTERSAAAPSPGDAAEGAASKRRRRGGRRRRRRGGADAEPSGS